MKNLFKYHYCARLRGILYAGINSKVFIRKPMVITNAFVEWGKGVIVKKYSRIEGVTKYAGVNFNPKILFGDGVSIQQNLHLTCAKRIEIGDNTAIAANVTITDIDHQYQDINLPVEKQPIIVKEVKIGADCKIYNNAVILHGTTIGKHCVVGANSVVKGEFADYSVIVGAPAKVIKKYNPNTQQWEKV